MARIIEIKVLENYQVWVKFEDNAQKIINLRPFIGKGFTEELLQYDNFRKVELEPGGGIAWFNGYDICPNFLRQLAEEKKDQAA